MNIIKMLETEEGFRSRVYYCTAGYPTIGIGWRIGERAQPLHDFKMMHICKAAAYAQLEFEIAGIIAKLEGFIPSFKDLNEPRQSVLISMAYQVGISGLMKFKKMLAAIDCLDWDAAAAEGLNSKWARQTPERAKRQMKVLFSGDWSQYVGLTKLEAVASQQMIGMSAGDYLSLKDMANDAINKVIALLDAISEINK